MKKKLLTVPLLIFIGFLMVWSCKHEPVEMITDGNCDTLGITYADVYSIFEKYCLFCHSGANPDAGLDLENYEEVAFIAQSGQLLGSVSHAAGFSPMPKNGDKLTFCEIQTISIWINDTVFSDPVHPCDPDTVYFERDLLPLLQSSCAQPGCHDAISMQDGVRLTDYNSIMQTADVKPFDPEGSDIYEVLVETDPAKRMPPDGPWPQENIDLVYKWITQGARNLFCDEGDCDTTGVTYSEPVSGIINKHCLGCHDDNSQLGGLSLQGYEKVVATANDDRLMGTVRHEPGYPAMPKNAPQLSDCKILQLEIWIQNGTPQ
jgi:mono/diheme cytochrome c family protein